MLRWIAVANDDAKRIKELQLLTVLMPGADSASESDLSANAIKINVPAPLLPIQRRAIERPPL